jgi:hypothetical protein
VGDLERLADLARFIFLLTPTLLFFTFADIVIFK